MLAITPDADSFRKSDLQLEWISAPELLCEAQAFASFNYGVSKILDIEEGEWESGQVQRPLASHRYDAYLGVAAAT